MLTHNIEKTFGLVIAFLFPGLIGLYALSLHIDVLSRWLTDASSTTVAVATAFLLLLLAAGLGVIISAARSKLIDAFWCPDGDQDTTWANRGQADVEAAYQNLLTQLYRFAQFHGNVVVAATGLFVSWLLQRCPFDFDREFAGALIAWLSVSYICWQAGRDLLSRHHEQTRKLLNRDPGGSVPPLGETGLGEP